MFDKFSGLRRTRYASDGCIHNIFIWISRCQYIYIYMKIPEGFTLHEAANSKPRSMYSIKLQRYLYGLK